MVKTSLYRVVPIVPRLHEILIETYTNGLQTVTGLSPNNLNRNGRAIAKAAGIAPWDDFFQALRTSRENDWKGKGVAEATYAAWLGHSVKVSRQHYVAPTEDEYAAETMGRLIESPARDRPSPAFSAGFFFDCGVMSCRALRLRACAT